MDALVRMTFLRKLPFIRRISREYRMHDFDFEKASFVEQISGAAFFIKRNVFEELGCFDEQFFIFYEEVDLCKRIRDKGYKVAYDPGIEIIHTGGQSRKKESGQIRCINIRSLLYYFRKHQKGIKKYSFLILFKTLFLIDLFLESFIDVLLKIFPYQKSKKSEKRIEKKDSRSYILKNCLKDLLWKW